MAPALKLTPNERLLRKRLAARIRQRRCRERKREALLARKKADAEKQHDGGEGERVVVMTIPDSSNNSNSSMTGANSCHATTKSTAPMVNMQHDPHYASGPPRVPPRPAVYRAHVGYSAMGPPPPSHPHHHHHHLQHPHHHHHHPPPPPYMCPPPHHSHGHAHGPMHMHSVPYHPHHPPRHHHQHPQTHYGPPPPPPPPPPHQPMHMMGPSRGHHLAYPPYGAPVPSELSRAVSRSPSESSMEQYHKHSRYVVEGATTSETTAGDVGEGIPHITEEPAAEEKSVSSSTGEAVSGATTATIKEEKRVAQSVEKTGVSTKKKAGLASVEKAAVASLLQMGAITVKVKAEDAEEDTSVTDISHDEGDDESITVRPLVLRRRLSSLPTSVDTTSEEFTSQTVAV